MIHNYHENFIDALPEPLRVREEKKKLEAAGVKYILSCWIDLLGVPKTKPVPISDFELLCLGKGPQFAVHSISFVPELGPADSDQIPVPDLDSLIICPWDKTCAWMFADLWWNDRHYNLCPRSALKRIVQNVSEQGYEVFAGIEPEFIVMKWQDGKPVKAFDNDPNSGEGLRPRRQAFGYDVEFSIDSMGFLGELIDIIEELGWNLHDVVAEGAYSQFELDFHYTDILSMADRLVFLRVLLKEVAKRHGKFVTFMPKPTIGDWRSGGHINFSLQDVKDSNSNVFKDGDKWSQKSQYAVGGLLAHSEALTAITCPTVNSYNGLVPTVGGFEGGVHTWAPTNITYGHNNRSAQFRLPQNRFCIENRAADLTMNVYLALAMTISAVVEGINNQIDPGKPSDFDLYALTDEDCKKRGIRRLPRNLLHAIESLKKDKLAEKVLGKVMLNSYINYKNDEWERYHQAVTDWEVKEYLRLY